MEQSIVSMIAKFKITYPYFFKDLDQESIKGMVKIYKEQLKEYQPETIDYVSNEIIGKEKHIPSLAEIKDKCEKHKYAKIYPIVERMDKNGYFKTRYEKEKIMMWLQEGIIPEWFKNDVKNAINTLKINANERKMLQ